MNKQISIEQLSVKYGNNTVLNHISFEIHPGDYIGIVGANGSGKTTLIKAILGLVPISSGQIKYDKQMMKKGYLPQVVLTNDSLFPAVVKEIVSVGLLAYKKAPKVLRKADYEKVDEILKKLDIVHLKYKRMGDLSGGQQQRVLLARAMVNQPEILILDEPTSALDPKVRTEFYELVDEINKSDKTTILLVSHDIESIRRYAKKMLVLDQELLFFDEVSQYTNLFAMPHPQHKEVSHA